jgi:dTDP-4-amino-4,6-dideoxygalactose transaminase
LQPIFSKYPFYSTGISEVLFKKGLCLPSGSNMTKDDMKRIERTLRQILKF